MKALLIALLLLLAQPVCAQPDAWFLNSGHKKAIRVSPGHTLSISYRGYLGQRDYVKAVVTDVNDSMITLGTDPALFPAFMRKSFENNPRYVFRKIYIRDIISFRRITNGRHLLKSTLVVGSIVGSYFLFRELSGGGNYDPAQLFWISLATGLGSTWIINALLPEAPKYYVDDGWRVVVSWDPVQP
jgi:hypothetical protein